MSPLDPVAGAPDPDNPGPFGISTNWFTPAWAASKGLSLVCDRCGLPFDRTGTSKHTPLALQYEIHGMGLIEEAENTHCPRFLGRDERWTFEGKALKR